MIPLQTKRPRDATSVVRGFVYQVDRTLESWLNLSQDGELHLEAGEDIDHVAELADGCRTITPEQVKNLSTPITLRSSGALEAIANFIEHRASNCNANLQFRFFTNSCAGREQKTSLSKPAIEVWTEIRAGKIDADDRIKAIKAIRQILLGAKKPPKFSNKIWEQFKHWGQLADQTAWLDLIMCFEWATGAPNADGMELRVRELIVQHGWCDETRVEHLYQRLFVYIIKLLTRKGQKILTPEMLESLVLRPESDGEHALYIVMRGLLDDLDQRQILLEEKLATQGENIAAQHERISTFALDHQHLKERVSGLEEAREQEQEFRHAAQARFLKLEFRPFLSVESSEFALGATAPPLTETPPPVEKLIQRGQNVECLQQYLAHCDWLSLEGGAGSGKTHLAILLSQANSSKPVIWMNCRGKSPNEVSALIDAAITSCIGVQLQRPDWLDSYFAKLGAGSLLILDDLTLSTVFDENTARLLELCQAATRHRVKFISTSHKSIPSEVSERLSDRLQPVTCPELSKEETYELLELHGAPHLDPVLVERFRREAYGHPVLLTALAREWAARSWTQEPSGVEELSRMYARNPNGKTIAHLVQSVSNEGRELLYRLNTHGGAFAEDDVQLLAEVPPAITRPRERMVELSGLWIQAAGEKIFLSSPLVQALGEGELRADVRRNCHLKLARHILRGTVDQFDAALAIRHFQSAEAWDDAGSLLIVALFQLTKSLPFNRPTRDAGLSSLWSQELLPLDISLHLRLWIRAEQLLLYDRWGEDFSFIADDLCALSEGIEPDAGWVAPGIIVQADNILARWNFKRRCNFLANALRHYSPEAKPVIGEKLVLPDGVTVESWVWMNTSHLRTTEDLRAWLNILHDLSPAGRSRAMSDDLAPEGCLSIANRLWLQESEKSEKERDWATISVSLAEAAKGAFELQMPLLGAAFTRAQMTVENEFRTDIDAAHRAADWALPLARGNELACFLIEEGFGRACHFAKRYDWAARWLKAALQRTITAYPLLRVHSLVCLSHALSEVGEGDNTESARLLRQALDIARDSSDLGQLEQVKASGELAIMRWRNGNLQSAFDALETAGALLIECRADTDEWRDTSVIFGHVLGYLCAASLSGSGPKRTIDGSAYMPPRPTMFISYHVRRAALYDKRKEPFFYLMIAQFAEAMGRDEKALHWAKLGLEQMPSDGSAPAIAGCGYSKFASAVLLLTDDFEGAWQVVSDGFFTLLASMRYTSDRNAIDPMFLNLSCKQALSDREGLLDSIDKSNGLAGQMAQMVLIPAVFRLGILSMSAQEKTSEKATILTNLCREFALSNTFWQEAARIIRDIWIVPRTGTDLISNSRSLAFDNAFQEDLLRVIYYLGASLHEDISPRDALRLHLEILPTVFAWFESEPIIRRQIIVKFFFIFWSLMLSQVNISLPFLFGVGFMDALRQGGEAGLKQLFQVLSTYFHYRGSEATQRWLVIE